MHKLPVRVDSLLAMTRVTPPLLFRDAHGQGPACGPHSLVSLAMQ